MRMTHQGRSLLRRAGTWAAALIIVVLAGACGRDADHHAKAGAPEAGVLVAGAAEGNLDVSVGTPMAAYMGRLKKYTILRWFEGGEFLRMPDDRVSPFADLLFPSIGIQTMPTAKALALELRGAADAPYLLFCRLEIANTTDILRRRIEKLVSARLGKDVTDHLIVAATHTHSGPGRIWPLPYFGDFGFDTYDAAITERIAVSAADVIVRAARDVRPAKIGMTVLHALDPEDLIYADRRKANDAGDLLTNDDPYLVDDEGRLVPDGKPDGPIKDDRLTLIRVEGTDGFPIAVAYSFPCHGTILGTGNLYLSGDLLGMTERKLSEDIGKPAPVTLFFQSAEGDIEPRKKWQAYQWLEEASGILASRIKSAYDATPMSTRLDGIDVIGATIRGAVRRPVPLGPVPLPVASALPGSGRLVCGDRDAGHRLVFLPDDRVVRGRHDDPAHRRAAPGPDAP